MVAKSLKLNHTFTTRFPEAIGLPLTPRGRCEGNLRCIYVAIGAGAMHVAGDYQEIISTLPRREVIITDSDRYKNYILDQC
jgi:hypothetical protein